MFARWKTFVYQIKREFIFYQQLLKHPDTPFLAKLLLHIAIGYLLLPFDLIPDWLPLLGQLDDLIIVGLLIWFALRLIPKPIVQTIRTTLSTTTRPN
jgi:uncharacterized membrane protein YkvA (DUF1232 family)